MPTDPSPRTPTSPDPGGEAHGDWPAQATETIVGLVDTVRQKTTGPATTAVRAAVWGLLIAIVGTAALVLFLVLFVRGLDILAQVVLDAIGIEKAGRATWIAHTLTGLLFLVPGVLLMRKGAQPTAD
ncbi:hypothetical protein PO878_21650 [Iamia majanohamensis]|uniref:Uncharacterized protein n=1 Tax=Iamia majanohamensis TaxID=467976 RepID=A0AAE9YE54_9ACTN|nr:hypothetical protein [Iamia majanohamensis]WCO67097.1 hypothetical protein PO878_21650 [Iamia majanohamensis]